MLANRFTDDFVFCHILIENPDLCKRITELAIGREIKEIVSIQDQKDIRESVDGKGVRFDVVFEDEEETIYDIEMQQSDQMNLAKRTRYYQSMIDLESLKRGARYNDIKDGYIVFICTFDPFKKGLHRYVAKTAIESHPDIQFDDGMEKIFLNAEYKEDLSGEKSGVREFLDYVRMGLVSTPLTEDIDCARERILNSTERREEFMTLLEKFDLYEAKGREKGHAEGIAEERARAELEKNRDNALYRLMRKDNLLDEYDKIIDGDTSLREEMLKKYGI